LRVQQRIRREQLTAPLLLQIHDELLFEVPAQHVAQLASLVREEMSAAAQLTVPLKVDVKSGPNWADCQPLD
jgi:DNA polymerase-1